MNLTIKDIERFIEFIKYDSYPFHYHRRFLRRFHRDYPWLYDELYKELKIVGDFNYNYNHEYLIDVFRCHECCREISYKTVLFLKELIDKDQALQYFEGFPILSKLIQDRNFFYRKTYTEFRREYFQKGDYKEYITELIRFLRDVGFSSNTIPKAPPQPSPGAQPKNISYQGLKFMAVQSDSYKTIAFHCAILTSKKEGKNLLKFYKDFWDDIDDLTDDQLQIFYSKKELPKKTGHKVIKELGILDNEIRIPSIFIWDGKNGLSNAVSINISDFTNQQIFDTIQVIVNGIKLNKDLEEVAGYTEKVIKEDFRLKSFIVHGDFIKNEITLIDSNNNTVIQNSKIYTEKSTNDIENNINTNFLDSKSKKDSKDVELTHNKDTKKLPPHNKELEENPSKTKRKLFKKQNNSSEKTPSTKNNKEANQKTEKKIIPEDKLIELTIKNEKVANLGDVIRYAPYFEAIKSLIIKESEVENLEILNSLEYLQSLEIYNSSIDFSFFFESKKITQIKIIETNMPNFNWMKKLKSLKNLKLNKNNIKDFILPSISK